MFRNQYKAAWVTLGENAGQPGFEVTPELLRTANITQSDYDMFAMIMEGERLSYETEWSEGFEDIASDLAYEGVDDDSLAPEMKKVEEQAAVATKGTKRMHERNGDGVKASASHVLNPVTTQDISTTLSNTLSQFENGDVNSTQSASPSSQVIDPTTTQEISEALSQSLSQFENHDF